MAAKSGQVSVGVWRAANHHRQFAQHVSADPERDTLYAVPTERTGEGGGYDSRMECGEEVDMREGWRLEQEEPKAPPGLVRCDKPKHIPIDWTVDIVIGYDGLHLWLGGSSTGTRGLTILNGMVDRRIIAL